MTTTTVYVNKRNKHKFIEVRNDGYSHNTVRQYIYTPTSGNVNLTGDGMLHRWRKGNLLELLEDYTMYAVGVYGEYWKNFFSVKTRTQRAHIIRRIRRANASRRAN